MSLSLYIFLRKKKARIKLTPRIQHSILIFLSLQAKITMKLRIQYLLTKEFIISTDLNNDRKKHQRDCTSNLDTKSNTNTASQHHSKRDRDKK